MTNLISETIRKLDGYLYSENHDWYDIYGISIQKEKILTNLMFILETIRKLDGYLYSENHDWYDMYGLFPTNPELVEECERVFIANEYEYIQYFRDRLVDDAKYIQNYLERYRKEQ